MAEVRKRRTVEETWAHLEALGEEMPRDPQGAPFIPASMPSYDDEDALGFSFFKTVLEDVDLSNLSLPRTYFGRSALERVEFTNIDLTESRMCWNDFIECTFDHADLSGSDMRASLYQNCTFLAAKLAGADLRQFGFEGCDFTDADLTGALVDYPTARKTGFFDHLTERQRSVIRWHDDSGDEPDGG